MVICFLFY